MFFTLTLVKIKLIQLGKVSGKVTAFINALHEQYFYGALQTLGMRESLETSGLLGNSPLVLKVGVTRDPRLLGKLTFGIGSRGAVTFAFTLLHR